MLIDTFTVLPTVLLAFHTVETVTTARGRGPKKRHHKVLNAGCGAWRKACRTVQTRKSRTCPRGIRRVAIPEKNNGEAEKTEQQDKENRQHQSHLNRGPSALFLVSGPPEHIDHAHRSSWLPRHAIHHRLLMNQIGGHPRKCQQRGHRRTRRYLHIFDGGSIAGTCG